MYQRHTLCQPKARTRVSIVLRSPAFIQFMKGFIVAAISMNLLSRIILFRSHPPASTAYRYKIRSIGDFRFFRFILVHLLDLILRQCSGSWPFVVKPICFITVSSSKVIRILAFSFSINYVFRRTTIYHSRNSCRRIERKTVANAEHAERMLICDIRVCLRASWFG